MPAPTRREPPVSDASSLIRSHEELLFLRAYPDSPATLRRVERQLKSFHERVAALRGRGADLSAFEEPEVSGIAGTSFSAIFSYDVVRRLTLLQPGRLSIDWDCFDPTAGVAPLWRRLFPLFEEDAMVEAHVPYLEWFRAALGRERHDLTWLLRRIGELQVTPKEKADLYASLGLPVHWDLGLSKATRTLMRLPRRRFFIHDAPMIRREDVVLASELRSPPLTLEQISRTQAQRILDMALETSAVRYRELHGFTYGDPRFVYRCDAGRGVEIFLVGVPTVARLPLRAYHAALVFKNGVPMGYFETLSLFERMEVGFNLYYTFRAGETAWLFARLLRLFHQVLSVTCFSIDPYQIGHENEEAIASGAFWFYRKLGFRPVLPEVAELTEREERKMRSNPGHRSSPSVLRRLAAGHMIYEMPGSGQGDWDRFRVRNIGLAAASKLPPAPDGLRSVLSLIPDFARWPAADRAAVEAILRAKAAPEEARYVHALQRHPRLRAALLRLGSR